LKAWREYVALQPSDDATKINEFIEDICRDPAGKGMGKPERLKGALSGWSSRRVTREHRLVYRVYGAGDQQTLEILRCTGHY
jgi:toxin YoeB